MAGDAVDTDADLLRNYFERNLMKTTTAGTNKERWVRFVRDAILAERKQANPSQHRSCPSWAKRACLSENKPTRPNTALAPVGLRGRA